MIEGLMAVAIGFFCGLVSASMFWALHVMPKWEIEIEREQETIMSNKKMVLVDVIKKAYLKHHLDDPEIGWDELDGVLSNAICNEIGADAFCDWLAQEEDRIGGNSGT